MQERQVKDLIRYCDSWLSVMERTPEVDTEIAELEKWIESAERTLSTPKGTVLLNIAHRDLLGVCEHLKSL